MSAFDDIAAAQVLVDSLFEQDQASTPPWLDRPAQASSQQWRAQARSQQLTLLRM
jgi:hypothetical protein